MREILAMQIGQCGNQVGATFWNSICAEHSITEEGHFQPHDNKRLSDLQLERISVFFNEGEAGRYVPRSLLVDLEPGCLDAIRGSRNGRLFRPDNYIFAQNGAGNLWPKGFYTEGSQAIDTVLDAVRTEAEKCDSLQGFQVSHAIGGGTGSGFGSLIMDKFKDEYPDRIVATYSVLPSFNVSDVVIEPYNMLLALHHLIESTDETVCLHNEALYRICMRRLRMKTPLLADLNHLIAMAMSGTTTSLRFPGQLNADLRKLAVNMVPFPRLHFFVPSLAPLCTRDNMHFEALSTRDLTRQMFDSGNMLVDCDPKMGKYMTIAAIYRGRLSMREVENELALIQRKQSAFFVEWLPHSVKTVACDVNTFGQIRSGTFIANTTAIQTVFKRNLEKFAVMFKRRAFLHWYTNEGMEIMEFAEAESNILDILNEYQQYQDASGDYGMTSSDSEAEEETDEQAKPEEHKENTSGVTTETSAIANHEPNGTVPIGTDVEMA